MFAMTSVDAVKKCPIAAFCQDWKVGPLQEFKELLDQLKPLWEQQSTFSSSLKDRDPMEIDSLEEVACKIKQMVDRYLKGKKRENDPIVEEAICSFPSYLHVYHLFKPK